MNEHEMSVGSENPEQDLGDIERELEDAKATIRSLLRIKVDEILSTKKEIAVSIKKKVLPSLIALKQSNLNEMQMNYAESVEENLLNIADPSWERISSNVFKLSPTEMRVSIHIRDGKTNKEIAKKLNLSRSTILTHRHNIRKKMGLKHSKVNLHSFLNFS